MHTKNWTKWKGKTQQLQQNTSTLATNLIFDKFRPISSTRFELKALNRDARDKNRYVHLMCDYACVSVSVCVRVCVFLHEMLRARDNVEQ